MKSLQTSLAPIQPHILANMSQYRNLNIRDHLPQSIAPPERNEPQTRYAILFNEGPGYLFIDYLGEGTHSVTMLVMSLADGQTYVRKLHDVRVITDEGPLLCDDELNAVSQSHVPRLITSEYYLTVPHQYGRTQHAQQRYLTAVTIWTLCNGGTAHRLWRNWPRTSKIPEPVLWGFLTTLLETLLEVNKAGVAHCDIHGGNFFLHWSPTSLIPELYLADFGGAQQIPQDPNDTSYNTPFAGVFDGECRPESSRLTRSNVDAFARWYAIVRADMRNAISILEDLALTPRQAVPTSNPYPADNFVRLARERKGVNGYSPKLVETLAAWTNIIRTHWNRPFEMLSTLTCLLVQIRNHSCQEIKRFNSLPVHVQLAQVRWMRSDPHESTPATWSDPSPLLNPQRPVLTAPRLDKSQTNEDRRNQADRFAALNDNEWNAANPGITIECEGTQDSVNLRKGQFRVVEIAYNTDVGRWHLTRPIDSDSGAMTTSASSNEIGCDLESIRQWTPDHIPVVPSIPQPLETDSNFLHNWTQNTLAPLPPDEQRFRTPMELPEDEEIYSDNDKVSLSTRRRRFFSTFKPLPPRLWPSSGVSEADKIE